MSGFYHDTLGEKDRHLVFEKINQFIDKLFAMPPVVHDYGQEDCWSISANKYRELQANLPKYSLKNLYYQALHIGMSSSLGKLSDGIKLGFETGFDSGSTLDYVYRNQQSGKNAVGRYVLDALGQAKHVESILLRDYSELNVKKGQKLITERHLSDKATFMLGNAFDQNDLANLTPKPTLAIVSGLYELFPQNHLIQDSLQGLAQAVPLRGDLIYTNQPWHPQLELIARSLDSHREGEAWVMRCRSQGEMDSLVAQAGFRKRIELIDEDGIFSVSIAERMA